MPKKLTTEQRNLISIGFLCLCLGFVAGMITGAVTIERNLKTYAEAHR